MEYQKSCVPDLKLCEQSKSANNFRHAQLRCYNPFSFSYHPNHADFDVYDIRLLKQEDNATKPSLIKGYLRQGHVIVAIGSLGLDIPFKTCSDDINLEFLAIGDRECMVEMITVLALTLADARSSLGILEEVVSFGVTTLLWASDARYDDMVTLRPLDAER